MLTATKLLYLGNNKIISFKFNINLFHAMITASMRNSKSS